jgi:fumarylacetoacetate (FAA) hydrolase family protein
LLERLLTPESTLPRDGQQASLVGRAWRPDVGGPSLVRLRGGEVEDITGAYATCRDLSEDPSPAAALRRCSGERVCRLADILVN